MKVLKVNFILKGKNNFTEEDFEKSLKLIYLPYIQDIIEKSLGVNIDIKYDS